MSYQPVPNQEPPTYAAPASAPTQKHSTASYAPNRQSYGAVPNDDLESGASIPAGAPPSAGAQGLDPDDDFKFGTSVASCDASIRMAFIRKVYLILLTQILTTTAVGATMYTQPAIKAWVQSNQWMMIVAVIGSFVSLFTLFAVRHKYPANFYALAGFTLVEAYTIGVATSFYDARVVLQALFLTAGLFIALTLFTFQTKIDFVSWGGFLYMGLWALILVGFVGMFFPHGKTFELVYASLGTLLFCGYTIYDTQLLLKHHSVDEYIVASVSLYLDVLNLFLNILRLLNAVNNDN